MAPYQYHFIWSCLSLAIFTELLSCHGSQAEFEDVRPQRNWPLVISTWDFGFDAAKVAWKAAYHEKRSAVDSLVEGQTFCELKPCSLSVGFGGNPDESGEPSLDALIMDGVTHKAAGVGNLRRVKNAIGVAKMVLDYTEHTLIAGDQATQFAVLMGFKEESLVSNETIDMWKEWKKNKCQPNFWKNVVPDPKSSCGPYRPPEAIVRKGKYLNDNIATEKPPKMPVVEFDNHDTVGMVVMDSKGKLAAGTTTNGLRFKIAGRVGDSPIPGSGAYADQEAGAAAATGDGDIMMRFVPTYQTVENMRNGMNPRAAAKDAISRIAKKYPNFEGAIIAVDVKGRYGAACSGMSNFTFTVSNPVIAKPTMLTIDC